MGFSVSITPRADHAHLAVAGELDATTTLQLRGQLDDALAKGCTHFTVDLAGLTFIDAAGLDAFVRLHNATTQLGGTVAFSAVSPAFRRVCGYAGLAEAFQLGTLSQPIA
jgi:anti-anti-sigma factor